MQRTFAPGHGLVAAALILMGGVACVACASRKAKDDSRTGAETQPPRRTSTQIDGSVGQTIPVYSPREYYLAYQKDELESLPVRKKDGRVAIEGKVRGVHFLSGGVLRFGAGPGMFDAVDCKVSSNDLAGFAVGQRVRAVGFASVSASPVPELGECRAHPLEAARFKQVNRPELLALAKAPQPAKRRSVEYRGAVLGTKKHSRLIGILVITLGPKPGLACFTGDKHAAGKDLSIGRQLVVRGEPSKSPPGLAPCFLVSAK